MSYSARIETFPKRKRNLFSNSETWTKNESGKFVFLFTFTNIKTSIVLTYSMAMLCVAHILMFNRRTRSEK